ncbi:MAG: hypothetical protein WCD79_02670 [Chthoniobacteraceae bacterium]
MKSRGLSYVCLASIVIMSVASLAEPDTIAGDSDTGLVIKTVTTSTPSMKVVLEILHDNGVVANYEGGFQGGEKESRVVLPTGNVPFDRFINAVTAGFGCKMERKAGVLTFYDPAARENAGKQTLNAMIDDLKIDNARADDAINVISKKFDVGMVCFGSSNSSAIPGKTVSLNLHNVTVREGLNQIVKAAGLFGWRSTPQKITGPPSIDGVTITVIELDKGIAPK